MHSPFRFFLSRLLTVLLLACGFIPTSARAQGFTAPTLWTLESLQNADSEWWQSLRVQTVPGVVYQLQRSRTLAEEGWENLASHYGNDSEWICPVMPGTEPVAPPPPGAPRIPVSSSFSRHVHLILETNQAGGNLVSWTSLDNGTLLRIVLPGVTLDPVWEEFDSFYLNRHGDYLFALSPRLYPPVNFTGGAPTLGPLDTAMLAGFIAALPTITSELETNIAIAASYIPVPEDPESKGFFRIHANWQVDSDGDGRLDWEEIIFDNNNPFCADTDGDGQNDEAQNNNGPIPSLDDGSPRARSVASSSSEMEDPPRAHVEQLSFSAGYHKSFKPNFPGYDVPAHASTNLGSSSALAECDSYGEFQSTFNSLSSGSLWTAAIHSLTFSNLKSDPVDDESYGAWEQGAYSVHYSTSVASFRLRLDKPAPAGGYRIPLRVAKWSRSYHPGENPEFTTSGVESEEIMLEVAAGATVGPVVNMSRPSPDENEQVVYIPATVHVYGYNILEGESGLIPLDPSKGICITPAGGISTRFMSYQGAYASGLSEIMIYWQKRKLSGGGTLDEWTYMKPDGTDEELYEGDSVQMTVTDPGIYQMQAVLLFPGGETMTYPYLRMGDAKSIKNGNDDINSLLQAGQPDYFGVARNSLSLVLREEATRWLGSTAYGRDTHVVTDPASTFNPSTVDSPKCNLFVTHLSNSKGARTSYWSYKVLYPAAPIAKTDWFANPEAHVELDSDGWLFQGVIPDPAPGMVVASPRTSSGTGYGHVGFLDYDGSWINAGKLTVNKSVHLLDPLPDYKPNNFRSR